MMLRLLFSLLIPLYALGFSVELPPKNASCGFYDHYLVSAMSNVTYCFGRHAQPFQICEACVSSVLLTTYVFDKVNSPEVLTMYNESCSKTLLRSDRIQVLLKLKESLDTIWSESNCLACYSTLKLEDNGTIIAEMTNLTKQFLKTRSQLFECYIRYTNMPYVLLENKGGFEEMLERREYHFNDSACTVCSTYYHHMNRLYDQIEYLTNKKVCMDLTDSMNRTRYEWSKLFQCHNPEIGIENIIPPAVIGGIIIIAFYVILRVRQPALKVKLMKQKRMQLVSADVDDYSYSTS